MTFKGMLKILINDYRKQHEEKMFSVVEELIKTRRELREVREQLRCLQASQRSASTDSQSDASTISLFVQYNGFFNQLCDIRQTMTIEELLVELRRLTGIPREHRLHLRVLSEDGSNTVCFLDEDLQRTLQSFDDCLKARMIISVEDNEERRFERTFSFDQSDV